MWNIYTSFLGQKEKKKMLFQRITIEKIMEMGMEFECILTMWSGHIDRIKLRITGP